MSADTLKLLMAGEFICPIRYTRQYEFLQDPQNAEDTQAWLVRADYRLARVGADGAYFMAPLRYTSADTQRLKESLLRARDVHGACIRMLDLIRHGVDAFECQVGETIQLAELEASVNKSSTLESQLRLLQPLISNSAARHTNRELVKRLLEHLTKEGYTVLLNADTGLFQITGKIDHLMMVIQMMNENQPLQVLDELSEDDLQMALEESDGLDLEEGVDPAAVQEAARLASEAISRHALGGAQ